MSMQPSMPSPMPSPLQPIEANFFDVRRSPVVSLASRYYTAPRVDSVIVAIMLAAAWSGVGLTLVGGLGTWMMRDLAVPPALAGLFQSAFFVGNIIGSIFTGAIAKKLGARRTGVLTLGLGVVAAFCTGVHSFPLVVLGRLLAGISLAGTVIFCSSIFVTGYSSRQTSLLSYFHAAVAGAAALGLAIARPLANMLGDWGLAFWMLGIVGMLPLAVLATIPLPDLSAVPGLPESRTAAPKSDQPSFFSLLRNRPFVASMLLMIAYVAAEQICTVFIAVYAESTLHWSPAIAAQLAALFWAGIIAGRLSAPPLTRFVSVGTQLAIGAAVMGSAIVLVTFCNWAPGLCALVFLAGLAGGPIVPFAFSRGVDQVGKAKTFVVSTCNIACCMGGVVGPLAMGLIAEKQSLSAGFWVFGVAMAAMTFFVTRERKTEGESETQAVAA